MSSKRNELQNVKRKLEANKKQMQAAEKRRADILREIEVNDQKIVQLQKEINRLRDDLVKSMAKRDQTELKLARLEKRLTVAEAELLIAERKLAHMREIYNTRVSGIYKQGKTNTLEVLLGSRDLGELVKRMAMIEVITKNDARLVKELQGIKASVEGRRNKLAAEQKVVNKQRLVYIDQVEHIKKVRKRVAMRQDLFHRELRRQERMLAVIEKEKIRLAYAEDVLESSSNMIAAQIQILERGGSLAGRGSLRVSKGGFMRPCSGRITSGFGMRRHPILKRSRMHTGVDFAAGTGTPIYAAQSGTVIMAGRKGGYGNTVVISHGGGITSLYAHNSRLLVRSGQRVNRGDKISLAGSTGLSTGPHLHFEIRVNGTPKNPMNWLN